MTKANLAGQNKTEPKEDCINNSEVEWVRENLEMLTQEYGNDEYFAIINQQVIDHDKNGFDLRMRVARKYRNMSVYVTNVFEYKEIALLQEALWEM